MADNEAKNESLLLAYDISLLYSTRELGELRECVDSISSASLIKCTSLPSIQSPFSLFLLATKSPFIRTLFPIPLRLFHYVELSSFLSDLHFISSHSPPLHYHNHLFCCFPSESHVFECFALFQTANQLAIQTVRPTLGLPTSRSLTTPKWNTNISR